jgi:putative peptidoglycan lipid II flippase
MSVPGFLRDNWLAGCSQLLKSRFLVVAASATGVSAGIQVLAFVRQAMIAAFFGIGRDLEFYVMAYAVATYVAFTFGAIFDSVVVSRLVRVRENEGVEAGRELAAVILRISLCIAGAASVLLLVLVPLLAPIIATGFGPEEWPDLSRLAWYFVPWICAYLPYYAVAAWHKAQWQFRRMFSAEIAVIVASIAVLTIWHRDIRSLPLAYAVGYAVGLVLLLLGSGLLRRKGRGPSQPPRDLLRNIGEFYLANQTGNIATLVDRHVQSFVPAGGVAAINYSSQLISNLASLLLLREAFIVPLAQHDNRADKLERLISGLMFAAAPLAGLIACFAPEIVSVLFERGRFDASATALTAEALRINAMGLLVAPILPPLVRMLQIIDRIHYTHVMFLAMAAASAIFGYLFVLVLELGVRGIALMQLASSVTACAVIAWVIARCGIALRWSRIFRYLVLAGVAAGAALLFATAATWPLENAWPRLMAGGSVYGLVVLGVYFLARSHMRGIIFGTTATQTSRRE